VSPIGYAGSRIQEQHQPSDFNLQDAAMSISLDTNDIVMMFQVRATAELKRELDEVGGGGDSNLSKKYHGNPHADIAQGRDGHMFGMKVGEALTDRLSI
jgi:hypothetical protein